MSEKHLGPEFEIHGGGLDLVFPHHENEIAQSRALGRPFARIWMHNGMLRFAGEEMHKSVGNDVSLKDALDRWGRETLLVFFLTGHWRKPLDYSDATLEAAAARAERFREVLPRARASRRRTARGSASRPRSTTTSTRRPRSPSCTSGAITSSCGARSTSSGSSRSPRRRKRRRRRSSRSPSAAEARAARDFDEADRLRAEIEAAGWDVRDEADGFRLVPPPVTRGARLRAERRARAVPRPAARCSRPG